MTAALPLHKQDAGNRRPCRRAPFPPFFLRDTAILLPWPFCNPAFPRRSGEAIFRSKAKKTHFRSRLLQVGFFDLQRKGCRKGFRQPERFAAERSAFHRTERFSSSIPWDRPSRLPEPADRRSHSPRAQPADWADGLRWWRRYAPPWRASLRETPYPVRR